MLYGGQIPVSLLWPAAPVFVPATKNSYPSRECHGRGPVLKSTGPHCRGNNGRVSRPRRCRGILANAAPATLLIRRRGGSSAHPEAVDLVFGAALCTGPHAAFRRPRGCAAEHHQAVDAWHP